MHSLTSEKRRNKKKQQQQNEKNTKQNQRRAVKKLRIHCLQNGSSVTIGAISLNGF